MALNFDDLGKASELLSAPASGIREVPHALVRPDPNQPRKRFDRQALDELAESIRAHGIIQPLVVKQADEDGIFLIVAGERRWRASSIAQLATVPVIIRDDLDTFAQVVENIQRENLTPLELYRWIAAQLDDPEMDQSTLAKRLGKSKTWISFYASISKMPPVLQRVLNEGLATDVTALNQLFKLWKQNPGAAERLATSGVPITRHAVNALAEKIQASGKATENKGASTTATADDTAGATGAPDAADGAHGPGSDAGDGSSPDDDEDRHEGSSAAEAGPANDGVLSRNSSSDVAERAPRRESASSGDPSPVSIPGASDGPRSPTGALPVRILARYDGQSFAVRYTAQRKGESGPEVLLENEGGLEEWAPLADLQVVSITLAPGSSQ